MSSEHLKRTLRNDKAFTTSFCTGTKKFNAQAVAHAVASQASSSKVGSDLGVMDTMMDQHI